MSVAVAPVKPSAALEAPVTVASVTLRVRDAERVAAFYETALGLNRLSSSPDQIDLGVDGVLLVRLLADPEATPETRRSAGLFHTAFLLPKRSDLADWIDHAIRHRIPIQGASDHTVSEAIYLEDPEHNGIEIYVDRPPSSWGWRQDGVEMDTQPMDVPSVRAEASSQGWRGMPSGARIGHVHLKVGDVRAAEAFYTATLGLEGTHARESARFLSWGGYHHHVGLNSWSSAGAPRRSERMTGLVAVEFNVRDPAAWTRLGRGGGDVVHEDPWGVRLRLVNRS